MAKVKLWRVGCSQQVPVPNLVSEGYLVWSLYTEYRYDGGKILSGICYPLKVVAVLGGPIYFGFQYRMVTLAILKEGSSRIKLPNSKSWQRPGMKVKEGTYSAIANLK